MAAQIRLLSGQTHHRAHSDVALLVPSSSKLCNNKLHIDVATGHSCSQLGTKKFIDSSKQERRHSIIARGILDAYRKDKGLLDRQREALKQNDEARQPVASEEDDEVCPAECVREIHTGKISHEHHQ